jgi:hypothetical protein
MFWIGLLMGAGLSSVLWICLICVAADGDKIIRDTNRGASRE